jgi:GAF domain-containing protein
MDSAPVDVQRARDPQSQGAFEGTKPKPGLADFLAGGEGETTRALRESEQRLLDELEATRQLQAISTQLIGEDGTEALYESIVDAAVSIMRSDFASMQMLHAERGNGGELRLLAFRGFNPQAAKFWEWVRADSESTCGAALRTGQRVIAADVTRCDFMAGTEDLETYLQTGIHAVQTTPLVSRSGRVLGMISTHWRKPHHPSERELRRFDVLARQAADLIERSQAERGLRATEARQAFLLKLGDALRPLGEPTAIQEEASRLLGRHLAVSRAMYIEFRIEDGREYVVVQRDYHDAETASAVGRVAAERLGPDVRNFRAGRTVTASDTEADMATDEERAVWRALGVRAYLAVPLVKDGRLVAGFGVHQSAPRVWTMEEFALVQDTAERTWAAVERARAEEELRQHAARLEAVLNTVPSAVWFTHDPDARRIFGNAYGARLLRLAPDANVSLSAPVGARPGYRVFCNGEELSSDQLPVQRAARGEEVHGQELDICFDDGSSIVILSHATPIHDDRGVIRGAVIGAIDITERKRVEESLRKSEADLRLRNEELARFNRAAVGREMRMIELKKEINDLHGRLGEPPRYPLAFKREGRKPHG